MMADHSIARCQWHTRFNDQNSAVSLQDAISQWSNQIMPGILGRFLDKHCPQSQIWRIEQLELDLGKLELDYLDEQLPLRLSQALEESLAKLFRQQKIEFSLVHQPHLKILNKNKSGLDIVRWHLLHGSRPWWDASNTSPLEILDNQIQQQPKALLHLLQDIGQKQKVRLRIARQWGEPRIKQTVQLLEPWNANFIFDFVEHLTAAQSQRTVAQNQSSDAVHEEPAATQVLPGDTGFKQHMWYWVLTHLIVERSSVFGTRQFVRSTIWQMAQHYQIDFENLVVQLTDTAADLQQRGLVAPSFVQSLEYLRSQAADARKSNKNTLEYSDKTAPQQATETYWQILNDMLISRSGNAQDPQGRRLSLSELLTRLGQQNGVRLLLLLKKHNESIIFAKYLSDKLDNQTMVWLVQKLAPDDQEFLLNYLNYSTDRLTSLQTGASDVWQSIVTHLLQNLSDSGKQKSLRYPQLVTATLQQVENTASLPYSQLLSLLTPPQLPSAGRSSFQLFNILHQLKEQAQYKSENLSSEINAISHADANIDTDSSNEIEDLAELVSWHKNRVQAGDNSEQIAQRLAQSLDYRGRLNISGLRQLFAALIPGKEREALELLSLLMSCYQEGKLPSLHKQDFGFDLSLLFIRMLLESSSKTQSTWPERIITELAQQMTLPLNQLTAHLKQHMELASQSGHISASTNKWIQNKIAAISTPEKQTGEDSQSATLHAGIEAESSFYQALPEAYTLAGKSDSERELAIATILVKLLQTQRFSWQENHLKNATNMLNQIMTALQKQLRIMSPVGQRRYLELLYAGLFGKVCPAEISDLATLQQSISARLTAQIEKQLSGLSLAGIHKASIGQLKQRAPLIWFIWHQVITQVNAPQLLQTLSTNPRGQLWLNALLPGQWQANQHKTLINNMQLLLSAALSLLPAEAKSIFMISASPTGKQIAIQLEGLFWQGLVREWQSHLRGGRQLTALFDSEQQWAIWLTELIINWAQYQQVQTKALLPCLLESLTDTDIEQQFEAVSLASFKQHLSHLAEAVKHTKTKVPYLYQNTQAKTAKQHLGQTNEASQSQSSSDNGEATLLQDTAGDYLNHPDFDAVLSQWLNKGLLPAKIKPDSFSVPQMWADILRHHPQWVIERVCPVLANSTRQSHVRARFSQHVNLHQVQDALSHLNLLADAEARSLHQIQLLLERLPLKHISWQEKQHWLKPHLIQAWLEQNWQLLAPESLLQQALWQILQSKALTRTQLIKAIQQTDFPVSPVLKLALDDSLQLLETPDALPNKSQQKLTEESALVTEHQYEIQQDDDAPLNFPIAINNAGVVIIQSFIKPLFERLQLLEKEQFISPQKQLAAVHYLQFLITGQSHTEEHHLLLNKILCGLPTSHPVEAGVDITDEEKDTVHSLITAVTNYWSAIGNTSIEGFRGNWMVRDGTLTETQDRWDLIVEKRAYDVLLTRAPMTWSIINLPWMKKPIYVTWPT